MILPLFQDQSFDTFSSDLSNKIRYNFNFVNLDTKSIQTQFIITQFACNHQTIRDNHEISCQHTDICHINIYSSRTNIANILNTSSLMVSQHLGHLIFEALEGPITSNINRHALVHLCTHQITTGARKWTLRRTDECKWLPQYPHGPWSMSYWFGRYKGTTI